MQTYFQHQDSVARLFKQQGWSYWGVLSIIARLLEELGELAREINHQYGDKKKRVSESDGDAEEEMGDVLYTLICFANKNNYDLDKAVLKSAKEEKEYDDQHPLSLLAELASRIGIFTDEVNLMCFGSLVESLPFDEAVETMTGNILRILEYFTVRLGYTIDGAMQKSLKKVVVRDKDRF